jgi:hypothetical protein
MSLTVYFTSSPIADNIWDDVQILESLNITHNLNRMAGYCGLYEPLWRPEEMTIPQPVQARDLLGYAVKGYEILKRDREHCIQTYSPSNGWGTYDNLLIFTELFISYCLRWPDSYVTANR